MKHVTISMTFILAACGERAAITVVNLSTSEVDTELVEWAAQRVHPLIDLYPVEIHLLELDSEEWMTDEVTGLYHESGLVEVEMVSGCLGRTSLIHELIHHRVDTLMPGAENLEHKVADWLLLIPLERELRERQACARE
jgi:hypothetical protein